MRSASVVDRECWHEAGHAVVGHYLGMTIVAIGFEWVRGNDAQPNPATWLATLDGFEQDIVATQLFAGRAAEIIKVGDYDFGALGSDYRGWETLGCQSSDVHYTQRAIEILIERDAALVRVYDKLMAERTKCVTRTSYRQRRSEEASPSDAGRVRIPRHPRSIVIYTTITRRRRRRKIRR